MRELIQVIGDMLLDSGMPMSKVMTSPLPAGTDLQWQIPPLVSSRQVDGAPLEAFWNYAEVRNLPAYTAWYDRTVRDLVLKRNAGYVPYRYGFPGCPLKRSFRMRVLYSMPDGWPNHDSSAACLFAVEAVEHMRWVLPDSKVVAEGDTHMLYLKGEPMFGVLQGAPYLRDYNSDACLEQPIHQLLSSFRGKAIADSVGNPVHRARAWMMANPGYVKDFDTLDILLQGFYFGYWRSQMSLSVVLNSRSHRQDRSSKLQRVFHEVIDGFEALAPNDKGRIAQAMLRLSPFPVARSTFLARVYDLSGTTPLNLPDATMARVRANLFNLYTEFCETNSLKP